MPNQSCIFVMKQQMKAIIIALMILSFSSTFVYAKSPQITDLTAQVQDIFDLVSANSESLIRIEEKIDGLTEPIDYSVQLAGIQSLIEGLPAPVDYSAIKVKTTLYKKKSKKKPKC